VDVGVVVACGGTGVGQVDPAGVGPALLHGQGRIGSDAAAGLGGDGVRSGVDQVDRAGGGHDGGREGGPVVRLTAEHDGALIGGGEIVPGDVECAVRPHSGLGVELIMLAVHGYRRGPGGAAVPRTGNFEHVAGAVVIPADVNAVVRGVAVIGAD